MRGPREVNTTSDILDHFIDDNYGDVLRSSLLNPSSYPQSLPSVKTPPSQSNPEQWQWIGTSPTERIVE